MSRYLTQGKHFSNLQVWFEDEAPTKGEDELYLLLGKTVRNEVNRAKREEVKVDGLGDLAAHPGMLSLMEETYNGMCREKGLGWGFPRAEVASYDAGGVF